MCEHYKEGKKEKFESDEFKIDKKSIGHEPIYEHKKIEAEKIHIPREHKIMD